MTDDAPPFSAITAMRKELVDFFKESIKHKIENEEHNEKLTNEIIDKFERKFGNKYTYIIRQYKDTIRISARYLQAGIVYFLAATKLGKPNYDFKNNICYIFD